MCLTLIEGAFLISGIWLMISGKPPQRLFEVMFGKGNYPLPPAQARLFGLLLASVLPLALLVSFMLRLLLRDNYVPWAMGFEAAYDAAVAIFAIVLTRRIRRTAAAGDAAAS